MRLALTTVVIVLLAGSTAWADKVVTADQTYDNVKVVGYSAGTLSVHDGKSFRRIPSAGVKQLTLDGEPMFNQAEELRAQGKFKDALAKYAQSRGKAMRGAWHQTLLKARLDQTTKLAGGTIGKPGPGDDNPPEEKVDPLSSLDALGADLATEPMAPKDRENWKTLDEQERKDATAKYQAELAQWKKKHSCIGAKVTWTMKVQEIKTDPDAGSTILCKSDKGFALSAEAANIDDAVRKAVAAHKPVAISGTIKECNVDLNRSESIFNADMVQLAVVLADAQAYLPDKAPKPTTAQATSQPASAPARK